MLLPSDRVGDFAASGQTSRVKRAQHHEWSAVVLYACGLALAGCAATPASASELSRRAAVLGARSAPPALPGRVRLVVLHTLGGPDYGRPDRRWSFLTPRETFALWAAAGLRRPLDHLDPTARSGHGGRQPASPSPFSLLPPFWRAERWRSGWPCTLSPFSRTSRGRTPAAWVSRWRTQVAAAFPFPPSRCAR